MNNSLDDKLQSFVNDRTDPCLLGEEAMLEPAGPHVFYKRLGDIYHDLGIWAKTILARDRIFDVNDSIKEQVLFITSGELPDYAILFQYALKAYALAHAYAVAMCGDLDFCQTEIENMKKRYSIMIAPCIKDGIVMITPEA